MNTTKEEAIAQIEKLKSYCEYTADSDESGAHLFDLAGQALDLALSALCPHCQEAADVLKQLQAENGRLKEKVHQTRWVPMEERPPEEIGNYVYPLAHIDREAWKSCKACTGCASCRHSLASGSDSKSACFWCDNHNKYKPRSFCPECGRPLTEEAWEELEKRVRGEK